MKAKDDKTEAVLPEKQKTYLPGSKYTLIDPVTLAGGEIKEVTLHALKAKDLIAAERELVVLTGNDFQMVGAFERNVCLVAKLVGLPQPDVGEFSSEDITELTGFLS